MAGRAITAEAGRNYARAIAPTAEREKDDFYPTCPEATIALLSLEQFSDRVWEPACGDGAISKIFEERGHSVVSTDLVSRGYGQPGVDFLLEHKLAAPDIITNPPFKLAEQFVLHGLGLGACKIAMLLRVAWLEGEERKRRIFDTTPLARVHISSRRLTMMRGGTDGGRGGGGMIAFAWFVWDVDFKGPAPTLQFFDWKDYAPEIYAAHRLDHKNERASAKEALSGQNTVSLFVD